MSSVAPTETTIETALPASACVPAAGLWLMMLPTATVPLSAVDLVPTLRPAPVIAEVAADSVLLTTFGTATIAGPSETVSAITLPGCTFTPPAGFWLMT